MQERADTTTRIHPELPIFRLDAGERAVLYLPGTARLTTPAVAREVETALAGSPAGARARELAAELARGGEAAAWAWKDLAERPFEPECLTLYLSNRCNLGCHYCYAMPIDANQARVRTQIHRQVRDPPHFPILSRSAIAAAARLVAGHCRAKHKPLTLVLHGGGEPTVHWDLLTWTWNESSTAAAKHGLELWSYIATHGVLAEARVRWLARHFDLVGLSCDGPPRIQDANRPAASNTPTSAAVERTAQILHEEGTEHVVRATITPHTVTLQTEILEYLCDRLFARTIRFEPAYDARRGPGVFFRSADAEAFVSCFLAARRVAKARECDLQLSGVRIDEIHGSFCNPLREVLLLMPDGRASACFLSVGNDETADDAVAIGCLDPITREFRINQERVATQRGQAAHIPSRCEQCHNIYHCARDCPDVCLLAPDHTDEPEPGFRCRLQKLLGRQLILELAASTSQSPDEEAFLGISALQGDDALPDCAPLAGEPNLCLGGPS